MLHRAKKLNRDFITELTNSPYWGKKKIVQKTKISSQYSIHFYNTDFLITTQIDGDGVMYFINNENDFPLKSSQIQNLLKRMQIEREMRGWKKPTRRNYNQIRAQIFNEMVN